MWTWRKHRFRSLDPIQWRNFSLRCRCGIPTPVRVFGFPHATLTLGAVNYVSAEAWKSFVSPKPSQNLLSNILVCSIPCSSISFPRYVDPLPVGSGPTPHISFQILGYLHPLELLQLSRTNKAFRELLHAPITELTWRNSLSRTTQIVPQQILSTRFLPRMNSHNVLLKCLVCDGRSS
jgi:hypothetical protein